ncbi:MAG: AAA family ATPase, partial [Actinomycetota bacterium]
MAGGEAQALVTTKLSPPSLPVELVARRRLNDVLDAAAADPLVRVVLVSAPAGSGKSTLLAAWQRQRTDGAWLQADPADRDPARFWGHVVGALARLHPDLEAVRPAVTAAAVDALPLIERIANELATSPPTTLVIDDYHLIDNPRIDEALERFIELVPEHVLLILGTRVDPGVRLSRLRVRSQLVEVRADDLAFAPDEAGQLLADERLSDDHTIALRDRTEGWAAGLVLARLSLHRSDDHDGFVAAFQGDDRLVVDYLTDEYLAGVDG